MDHMLTGQKTSLNVGEEISVEVTLVINLFRFIRGVVCLLKIWLW